MAKNTQHGKAFKKLLREIKNIFISQPNDKLSANAIRKILKSNTPKHQIIHVLNVLEDQKIIRHQGKGKFQLFEEDKQGRDADKRTQGYVDMTLSGSAYIVSNDIEDDIFVNSKNLSSAFHGDLVEIKYYYPRRRRRPEGKVLKVLERSSEVFIGPINHNKKFSIVYVEKRRVAIEIVVKKEHIKNAQQGDLVIVKVVKWPVKEGQSPIGEVTQVLGKEENNDIRMKSILIENGFDLDFPKAVIDESEAIPVEIPLTEINRRRDMRKTLTFTIDPKDAKDFDDAISYEKLDNGTVEIGVHIADVSHYILPDTELDKEAFRRSTSVYLADRVLPMLPEKLSNELCSLRPNEDKLCYSVIFTFDIKDTFKSRWLGKTVIHSDHRFTYEDAQEVLDGKSETLSDELLHINRIAVALRKKRFETGSINFSTDEVRFVIDDEGRPIDAYVKETGPSNHLIEEFMLLANKSISLYINEKKQAPAIPFIYRVHDLPDEEKLNDIAALAADLGLKIDVSEPNKIADSFNAITAAAEKDPAYKILSHLAIRAMAKAEYSSDNIGHYGLGFTDYSHFTSPIRRYSDVIAHRILHRNEGDQIFRLNKAKLEEKCEHISRQERKAVRAERDSIKLMQVQYAEQYQGQVVTGTVNGMIDKGLFVEFLKSKSEGLLSFDQFDEPYQLGDSGAIAIGQRSGIKIKIGDTIEVKIAEVDLNRRQIDLELG